MSNNHNSQDSQLENKKYAVLGAGITGLAAARRLLELRPDAVVHLWEKSDRTGGVLQTLSRDGCQIEQSADNFITTIPWGLDLCKELGLGDEIVQTNPAIRRTYVVRKGKLHLLPDGFLMMAPTKLWPMAVTPILSPFGKLRAGLELFIKARRDDGDETLADFARRRLGKEVFERLIEPLVSGVYAADMEKLSLMATLPRFREMEKKYGSMIWAMQRQMKANKAAHLAEQSGARYSMFVTLKSGLSSMCDAIATQLPAGTLQPNRKAVALAPAAENRWTLTDSEGKTETYDGVISGLPAHELAKLLATVAKNNNSDHEAVGLAECCSKIALILGGIEHQGTAIATFAFKREQMKFQAAGMGFVVPKIERSPVLAGSFSSLKYLHRAPEDKLLIRIFAGGARAPEMADMADGKLVPILLSKARKLLKIEGEPLFSVVAHWPNTMPQYHLGHLDRIREITDTVAKMPGFELGGNYFNGVGVPNCARSGQIAAEAIINSK